VSFFRRRPIASANWIAIDCETSGLDASRDRLLSVGAVPVREGRIRVGERFASLVQQTAPSEPSNILVHGIGGDAQLAGRPLAEVMRGLATVAGDFVPVGLNAAFDAAVLRRHGFVAAERWLDLAVLAPALFPQHRKLASLEEWLAVFGIAVQARHDALADAFSTAQLLLIVLAEARRQGMNHVEDLRAAGRARRWL